MLNIAPDMFIHHYDGMGLTWVALGSLFLILLIISVVDYYTMLIPNSLIMLGISIGAVYRILEAFYVEDIMIIFKGVQGFIVGGALIGLIMVFSLLVFKKDGMGMGDLKLMAMIGLFIGGKQVVFTLYMAIILGSAYAIVVLSRKKQEIFPFGPFLAVGAVIVILWGDTLWRVYLNYLL